MQVRNDVGSELITLKGSVSAAIELIGEPTSKNQSIANVSALYSELKINLVARCKELERLDNAGKLNEDEEFILLPAIREASLHCKAKVGCKNKDLLFQSLYDAQDYLSYYISNLES